MFILWILIGIVIGFGACYWLFVSRNLNHIKRDLEAKANALTGEAKRAVKDVANKI